MNRVAGAAHAEWLRQAMASAPSTADVAVRAPRAATVRGGGCSRRRRRLQPHMAQAASPTWRRLQPHMAGCNPT